jgi:hypothetical protein
MAREGVPLIVIQRQLGHSNLGITSVYLQGIDKRRNHRDGPRAPRPDGPGERVPRSWLQATLGVGRLESGLRRGLALACGMAAWRKPTDP